MMKKRLIETAEVQVVLATTMPNVMFSGMCSEWSGLPYAELSVLLAQLRALHCIHHTHHWQALGDNFYGDHLLFGRIYEAIAGQIDDIGEKVIGVGCVENVKMDLQISQMTQFIMAAPGVATQTSIPSKDDLAKCSLVCELDFLRNCALASEMLNDAGLLTRGVDNFLQGLEDTHEGFCYLLKQRVSMTNMM